MKARVKNTIPAMTTVRDELERLIVAAEWFPAAPFDSVGLIIRYGLENAAEPEIQPISRRHRELPVAIEVDTHDLLRLHRNPEQLIAFLRRVTLDCLLSVARRYSLPDEELRHVREAA